jgi:hypothetical protein
MTQNTTAHRDGTIPYSRSADGTCRTRCPRRVLATDQMPGLGLRFHSKTTNGDPLIRTTAALITVRKHLDEIDQQIVALLNQRARIVAELGRSSKRRTLRLRTQRESSRSWITSFNSEALDPFHLIVFAGYIRRSYR